MIDEPQSKMNMRVPRVRLQAYARRMGYMVTEQSAWRGHWQELSRFVQPRMGRYLGDKDKDKGEKQRNNIIDSTATRALRTLTAGLMAGVTSPARPWFSLGTPDLELNEFEPVKDWLFQTEQRMRMVFNKSNMYNALHRIYEELGLFGTGVLLIDEDVNEMVRGSTLTAGQYMLELDQTHRVHTMARRWPMTVEQIVNKFGYKNCSKWIQHAHDRQHFHYRVTVAHFITKNPNYREGAIGPDGFMYTSAYWETDERSGQAGLSNTYEQIKARKQPFLKESGYYDRPFVAPRWDVSSVDDVYGRSPGMEALGDVKQLQHQQLRKAELIDKQVDPPLRAPPELLNQQLSTLPGGVTYAPNNATFEPLYNVNPDSRSLLLDISDTARRIDETFYVDLFRMISNVSSAEQQRMTATEIAERHEEKLILLGPALERLHNELLDPMIDRVFNIMARAGALPEPPPEIENSELRVKYISLLAQAQEAVGTAAIDRLASFATNASQFQPEVLDKLDFDQAVDEYGRMLGVPPKIVRADDAVLKMREARNQAIEAERQQQARVEDAGVQKDLATAQAQVASDVTGGLV